MNDVPQIYRSAGLPNLANLYEYAVAVGLRETGSSSINGSFRPTVEAVKHVMRTRAGVRPSNERTAALWEALGDPDATFYFGGYRQVDEKREMRLCGHRTVPHTARRRARPSIH